MIHYVKLNRMGEVSVVLVNPLEYNKVVEKLTFSNIKEFDDIIGSDETQTIKYIDGEKRIQELRKELKELYERDETIEQIESSPTETPASDPIPGYQA